MNFSNRNVKTNFYKHCMYSPIQYLKAIGHSMDRWVDNIETREFTDDVIDDTTESTTNVGDGTEIGDDVEAREPIDENIPDELKCVICWQRREATVLYLPCKHANTCQTCAETIMQSNPKTCPTCRAKITASIDIFT